MASRTHRPLENFCNSFGASLPFIFSIPPVNSSIFRETKERDSLRCHLCPRVIYDRRRKRRPGSLHDVYRSYKGSSMHGRSHGGQSETPRTRISSWTITNAWEVTWPDGNNASTMVTLPDKRVYRSTTVAIAAKQYPCLYNLDMGVGFGFARRCTRTSSLQR